MRILGIDPGTAIVGWAILDTGGRSPAPVAYGAITTPAHQDLPLRLRSIHTEMQKLIRTYRPEVMSVEDLFFATNAKTAFMVGQARGVILTAAALSDIPVVSYTPLNVKSAITGDGKADKAQVQRMVTAILKLKQTPKPDDTADALAIALTHAYSYKMKRMTL